MSLHSDDLPLECIAFMLIRDGQVLAERRSPAKRVVPGVLAIPGGHLDPGETVEEALHRELVEELGITAERVRFVCTLLHRSEEFRKLHYFAIDTWTGTMAPQEADGLHWVRFDDPSALDLDVDRFAVQEYQRLYHPG
jgi:mutator protein MutT